LYPNETPASAGYGAILSEVIPLIPKDMPSRISTEMTNMKSIKYKKYIPIEKITAKTRIFLIRVDLFTIFVNLM